MKSTSFQKMDSTKKKPPDYTDIAYKEAVARLRYLLAESYSPQATPTKIPHVHTTKPDDSGDETDASMAVSERSRHHHTPFRLPYYSAKRSLYTDTIPKLPQFGNTLHIPKSSDITGSAPPPNTTTTVTTPRSEGQQPPPELMAFIGRQEDYIEQLEKESQYCREELSNLLSKVKDVISENEGLHEKEKSGILKSVFDYLTSGGEEDEDEEEEDIEEKKDKKKSPIKKKRLEGPSIVFESRISELEAQLTQTKIDLRKAQEEADTYKKKMGDIPPGFPDSQTYPSFEACKQQIETLQREKEELTDNVAKLTFALSQLRDKEADATHKVKRSFDLVDQAQFEKNQAELEVRRLKEELERQHEKLRDLLQEQGRRVQDERSQAERRYAQQVEQLTCDLSGQWDAAGKLQLELEKQRRTESELRRELQQKSSVIDELKKELQTKIAGLQSEATQSAAERGSLEQELAASRLASERAERDARQESTRLQAEVTALRQRLDRADADLLHSRRENLRLTEQIASLERELNLAKMMKEGSEKAPAESGSPSKQSREKELTSMILDMEAKHVHTVGELENMIQSQTHLMEKLKDECRSLTQKLEESSARHKEEKAMLRVEKAVLLNKLEQVWKNCKELQKESLERGSGGHSSGMQQQTTPTLKVMSQDPSMALSLSSSHSMSHSQVTSPSRVTSHSSKSILLSPTTHRQSQSQSPSKAMAHNQITSHNLSTSSKHNTHHSPTTKCKQTTSPSQTTNQSTFHNQITDSQSTENNPKCNNSTIRKSLGNNTTQSHPLPNKHQQSKPCHDQCLGSPLRQNKNPSPHETHPVLSQDNSQALSNPSPHPQQYPVHNSAQNKPITSHEVQKTPSHKSQQTRSPEPTAQSQALGPSPSQSRNLACLLLGHPPLSPWRREVDRPPLTLEDLATDGDSTDSQSAQLQIFE